MELLSRDAIDYTIAGHSLADLGNFNEQLVIEAMNRLYASDTPPCSCSLCVEDIYALALNSLPPRYIQATSVRSYTMSPDFVSEEKVHTKVAEAARKVKERPNH